MKKNILKKFNTQHAVIVISPYPKKGELYSAGASGIASYTKNVVSNMQNNVIVLADIIDKPTIYQEDNALVVRCFQKNSPNMWIQLINQLQYFNKVKKVLIQFDFALYGSISTSALIIPFLSFLNINNYSTSIVVHSIIEDIKKLHGHVGLNLEESLDQLKSKLYNFTFHTFYKSIGILVDNVIVLEKPLKKILKRFISEEKITTIPHGVDTSLASISKLDARKDLGIPQNEYIVLFFGYVNWFKGADFFASGFHNTQSMLGKKIRFIIAGGQSSTMKQHDYYKSYFTSVMSSVCDAPNMDMTGYVSQEDIAKYFSAADLVVFPYRYFMNASGVMSLTISYKKPFIVSNSINEMFDSPDFNDALIQVGLNKKDISFSFNNKSLINTTEKVLKNGLKKKMIMATNLLRNSRQYSNTALQYKNVLFSKNPTLSWSGILKNRALYSVNAFRSLVA